MAYEFLQSPAYRQFRKDFLNQTNDPPTGGSKPAEPLDIQPQGFALSDTAAIGEPQQATIPSGTQNTSSGGGFMNYAPAIANAAGSVVSAMGKAQQEKNKPEGYIDTYSDQAASINSGVDTVKDTIATAGGPMFQLFRGIQKMGEGAGNMIGGDIGGGISNAFSPEESTIHGWVSKDYSTGEKFLGTVPFLGGVLMNRKKEERKQKWIADKYRKEAELLESERARKERLEADERQIENLTKVKKAQLGYITSLNNY